MLREEGDLEALLVSWAYTSSTNSLPPSSDGGPGTLSEREGGKEGGKEGNGMPATPMVPDIPDVFDRAVLLSYILGTEEEFRPSLSAEVWTEKEERERGTDVRGRFEIVTAPIYPSLLPSLLPPFLI